MAPRLRVQLHAERHRSRARRRPRPRRRRPAGRAARDHPQAHGAERGYVGRRPSASEPSARRWLGSVARPRPPGRASCSSRCLRDQEDEAGARPGERFDDLEAARPRCPDRATASSKSARDCSSACARERALVLPLGDDVRPVGLRRRSPRRPTCARATAAAGATPPRPRRAGRRPGRTGPRAPRPAAAAARRPAPAPPRPRSTARRPPSTASCRRASPAGSSRTAVRTPRRVPCAEVIDEPRRVVGARSSSATNAGQVRVHRPVVPADRVAHLHHLVRVAATARARARSRGCCAAAASPIRPTLRAVEPRVPAAGDPEQQPLAARGRHPPERPVAVLFSVEPMRSPPSGCRFGM